MNLFQFGMEAPILIVKDFIVLPVAFGSLTLHYRKKTTESIHLIEQEYWNDDNWMSKVLIVLPLTPEEFDRFAKGDMKQKKLVVENQIGTSVKVNKLLARSNPTPHFQVNFVKIHFRIIIIFCILPSALYWYDYLNRFS